MLRRRPWELLAHASLLAALTLQFADLVDEKVIVAFNIAWILFYFVCSMTEGLRIQQIVCGLSYLPFTTYVIV